MIVRRAAAQTSRPRGAVLDPVRQHHRSRRAAPIRRRVRAHGQRRAAGSGAQAAHAARVRRRPSRRRPPAGTRALRADRATTGAHGAPLDQAYVDQIAGRLAVYLGPIAPIVAKKAARDATARRDFLLRVADSLGTQERAAFLREMGFGGG